MWHCTLWRWGTCVCVTFFTSRTPTSCCHARWCEGEEQWWMLVMLVCAPAMMIHLEQTLCLKWSKELLTWRIGWFWFWDWAEFCFVELLAPCFQPFQSDWRFIRQPWSAQRSNISVRGLTFCAAVAEIEEEYTSALPLNYREFQLISGWQCWLTWKKKNILEIP